MLCPAELRRPTASLLPSRPLSANLADERRAGIHHGLFHHERTDRGKSRPRPRAPRGGGGGEPARARAAGLPGPHRRRGPDRGGGRAGRVRPRLRAAGAPRRGALARRPGGGRGRAGLARRVRGPDARHPRGAGARPLGPNRPGRRHTGWGAGRPRRRLVAAGLVAVDAGEGDSLCRPGLALEDAARRRGQGLWAAAPPVPTEEVARLATMVGRFAVVEGRVRNVGERERRTYLNFAPFGAEGVTVTVSKRTWRIMLERGFSSRRFGGGACGLAASSSCGAGRPWISARPR